MIGQLESWEHKLITGFDLADQSVVIPLSDDIAYTHFQAHRWVYDKLKLSSDQNVVAMPHGIKPNQFPVFSKPIINLFGMSKGATKLTHWDESMCAPGHFWMEYLNGEQYTVDIALHNGKRTWMYPMKTTTSNGSITMFEYISHLPSQCQNVIDHWINKLNESAPRSTHSGVINVELIYDRDQLNFPVIIEFHMRPSVQFFDLYGDQWQQDLYKLYKHNVPLFGGSKPGYSLIKREEKGHVYYIDRQKLTEIERDLNVTIIPTVHQGTLESRCANDEYTDRIAFVNGYNYSNCLEALNNIDQIIMRP